MTSHDHNPYAAPTADDSPPEPPKPRSPDQATTGQRLAGALMIVNAVIVIAEAVVVRDVPQKGPTSPGFWFVPALIDLGIGMSLVSGSRKTLGWAILRVSLGLIVATAARVVAGDVLAVMLQFLVSASMLLLLLGEASRARIAAGATAFGVYGLVWMVSMASYMTGTYPLGHATQAIAGDIEPGAAGRVTGKEAGYSLTMPNDQWHLRKAEAAKKDNPIVDRWLVRPDKDAHVIVIAEQVPGQEIQIDLYADAIVDGARKASKNFAVVDRSPLPGRPETGRFVHTTSTIDGLDLEYYYALHTANDRAYQVIAFTRRSNFASLAGELRKILDSFELPAR